MAGVGVRRRRPRAAAVGADPGAAAAGIGRFLALTGRADARVAELLRHVNPKAAFAPATRFVVDEPELAGIPVLHLFRDGRTLVTLLLWVVFFMSLLDLYFLSNWLPTVLNDLGASVSEAAAIGSMLQVGGVVGMLCARQHHRPISFRALALVYSSPRSRRRDRPVGHSAASSPGNLRRRVLHRRRPDRRQRAGGGVLSDLVRGTGVGWALGIGRVGSIVGPLVGGVLLTLKWSPA